MSFARGALVLVDFPYSDPRGLKRRPACVISVESRQGPDVIVAMVTSSRKRWEAPGPGDVLVQDWGAAGLLAPSVIRTGRLLVVEHHLLSTTLGDVSQSTLDRVDAALRDVLGLT